VLGDDNVGVRREVRIVAVDNDELAAAFLDADDMWGVGLGDCDLDHGRVVALGVINVCHGVELLAVDDDT